VPARRIAALSTRTSDDGNGRRHGSGNNHGRATETMPRLSRRGRRPDVTVPLQKRCVSLLRRTCHRDYGKQPVGRTGRDRGGRGDTPGRRSGPTSGRVRTSSAADGLVHRLKSGIHDKATVETIATTRRRQRRNKPPNCARRNGRELLLNAVRQNVQNISQNSRQTTSSGALEGGRNVHNDDPLGEHDH